MQDFALDFRRKRPRNNDQRSKSRKKTSQDRWEIQQLVNSGALSRSALAELDIDEEHDKESLIEEDLDVEVTTRQPDFLSGQTKFSINLKPVQIIRNPEGSLQKAALSQSSFAKERKFEKIKREKQEKTNGSYQKRSSYSSFDSKTRDWKSEKRRNDQNKGLKTNLSIKQQRESLPIYTLKKPLMEAISKHQILCVIGETGSGKTTQMVQYLADEGYARNGMIGCTQPRRVAASSVAKRVAEEVGCRLGDYVGYTIRFKDVTSSRTRIKYMTDGMLMREYLNDKYLDKYSVLILDEAHERTINTDILFPLLKKLAKKRKDMKIIVTSATLDAEKFSSYFYSCPIFTIPGRNYPVEIFYTNEPEADYVDAALVTVMQIHLSEPKGDILLFLTGQEEIETSAEILYNRMKSIGPNVAKLHILPAYGALPSEMQSKIFEPAPEGTRKCVIATNIAEASLTIDGIYYVVDPGFVKQKVYNAKLGMDTLQPVPISQASARQRAGRAGRTGPGKCYRLYTEKAFKNEMLPSTIPEMQRTNLANVVLQLKAMKIEDLLSFDFMDPPPSETLIAALQKLYALEALGEQGKLTKLGRKMAEFPLDPVLAKTLLTSLKLRCTEEVVIIVAMLSVESPFYRPRDKQVLADQKRAKFVQPEGDHLTLLSLYQSWKKSAYSRAWCNEHFVQFRSLDRAREVRKQLLGILERHTRKIRSSKKNYESVQKAITSGFFMNAAKKDHTEGYKSLSEGQTMYIHPSSSLFRRPVQYVIYHELVMTSKEYMRNCMVLDPKWLLELAPNYFKQADPYSFGKRKRKEKIQPMSQGFGDKDAWRLSKRPG
eukprot:augustus_masked-scaffold_9-processed-gene-9.42-mRNA-1 protein AED:0.01 eAED:0.02 QI:0/-1/0/1/-1/1/1/0/827